MGKGKIKELPFSVQGLSLEYNGAGTKGKFPSSKAQLLEKAEEDKRKARDKLVRNAVEIGVSLRRFGFTFDAMAVKLILEGTVDPNSIQELINAEDTEALVKFGMRLPRNDKKPARGL